MDSGTTSTGQGGSINVTASGNLSMSGASGGVFSRTSGTETGAGAGGTIFLKADQNFTLSNGATVSASSSGPGNAGNITLGANNTILIDKATVTTEAREALGGNIKLTAGNEIQLTDSQVTSRFRWGRETWEYQPGSGFYHGQNSNVSRTANRGWWSHYAHCAYGDLIGSIESSGCVPYSGGVAELRSNPRFKI